MAIQKTPLEQLPAQRICVGMGEIAISVEPQVDLVCLGLGSCIAICAYAPRLRVAAMVHVMLPSAQGRGGTPPAKYADSAVPLLESEMRRSGVFGHEVQIALVGGATIFPPASTVADIGHRNLLAVREQLKRTRFRIIREDVGGRESRTVTLHVATGEVWVRTVRTGESVLTHLGGGNVR